MVRDAEASAVRGARHGAPANEAASSLNILRDLSASGASSLEADRRRSLVGWLAGALVAGIAAGIAWLGEGNDGSTRSILAKPPAPWDGRDLARLQEKPVPVLPEKGEQSAFDVPRVLTSEASASPGMSERTRMPVVAEVPAPTTRARVAEARPAKVMVRREARPDTRRRALTAMPVSPRARQASARGVAKRRAAEQRPLPRPVGGGTKPMPRQDAAVVSKPGPRPDAPRSERDIDIITAIVK